MALPSALNVHMLAQGGLLKTDWLRRLGEIGCGDLERLAASQSACLRQDNKLTLEQLSLPCLYMVTTAPSSSAICVSAGWTPFQLGPVKHCVAVLSMRQHGICMHRAA